MSLMTATEVGVGRRPGPLWQEPTWDLLTAKGAPLGSVVRQPGGSLKPDEHIRYDVAEADGTVVWHLDRLHRHPKELEEFFEVCDAAKVKDLATVQGDIDLSTDDGRFHARIMGAVARKASDDQSRRVRRKHLELAESGRFHGGHRDPRLAVRPW